MHNSTSPLKRTSLRRKLNLLLLAGALLSPLHLAQAAQPAPHKAYVYTELQISVPFAEVPWTDINKHIQAQPGFLNKTWLAGAGNNSAGGFYCFDSVENAQKFVTQYFPQEAKAFGVAQTTRVFDATVTEEASRDMGSVYYVKGKNIKPGAFVYTEVQVHAEPFNQAVAWQTIDENLKIQPGLLSKTWLSGLHTATPGGFYAFDTLENARNFAINVFPKEAAALNAAFYTRVFDGSPTEKASMAMHSPYYK